MSTISQNAEILKNLNELMEAHRPAIKQQRIYERIKALVFGEVLALGRHTVTQLLLALGFASEDWTAWYRLFSAGRFEEEAMNEVLLKESLKHIGTQDLLVLGGDGTQTPRTSAKMEGVGYGVNHRTPPFKRGIHLMQRWFHGALFLPAERGFSRALPISFMPAFTEKAKRTVSEARREWEAAHLFLQATRSKLVEWGREQQPVLFLADGSYDTIEFWKGLPKGVHALVRSAKNRALRHMPSSDSHKNRKYGDKAPKPEDFWREKTGWSFCNLTLRGKERRLRYRVEGPFLREKAPNTPLFLLIVGGEKYTKHGREKHREPVPYLINAKRVGEQWVLPLSVDTLLFWAWQRWELEVTHRELKSNFGLGEKQAWHPLAAITTVQWSAWVYAILILAGYRTWQLTNHPHTQIAWWSGGQRWSFNTLIRHYRASVGGGHTFQASWFTIQNNLPEKIPAWLDLRNALYGSARL